MAKIKENTQIPKKAIEGAAKYGDEFSITAIDIATYFKDSIKEKKPVPYSVVSNKLKKEILSIDLAEGMTIKAVTTQNQRKAIENTNSIDEH